MYVIQTMYTTILISEFKHNCSIRLAPTMMKHTASKIIGEEGLHLYISRRVNR